jgi:hypothetical protein
MGGRRSDKQWREFERLIARIETDADPHGMIVKSPDRVRCKETGKLREVDATIRSKAGSSDVLITIECRDRARIQDVTWIEQLASKKQLIGAALTIAVSSSGFSADAEKVAARHGIMLRQTEDLALSDLSPLLGLDLVVFWHKGCCCTGVAVRSFRPGEGDTRPEVDDADYILPSDTDIFAEIFHDDADGTHWSINSIWLEVQETLDPYADIEKAAPATVRTARIHYPGTVHFETPKGPMQLGHVFLGMAMWIEPEFVSIQDAQKTHYSEKGGVSIQRVEFSSARTKDWRISLQAHSGATDVADVRVGGNWPHGPKQKCDDK